MRNALVAKSATASLVWEYDGDGACSRRISFAADASKLGEQACN